MSTTSSSPPTTLFLFFPPPLFFFPFPRPLPMIYCGFWLSCLIQQNVDIYFVLIVIVSGQKLYYRMVLYSASVLLIRYITARCMKSVGIVEICFVRLSFIQWPVSTYLMKRCVLAGNLFLYGKVRYKDLRRCARFKPKYLSVPFQF